MRTPALARHRGALIGAAVGDALGAAFEGHHGPVPDEDVQRHVHASEPVYFTDDTAMTIAVAESLLASGGLDEDHLARTFVAHHQREPHRGYGAGTSALLRRLESGSDWRAVAPGQFGGAGSYGNGAAMRSAPYGLWEREPQQAAVLASRAALVTHTHAHAIDGAAVLAAAVSHALHQTGVEANGVGTFMSVVRSVARTTDMVERLRQAQELHDASVLEVSDALGTGVAALEAVPAAICAFLHSPTSLSETVRFAIGLGGDTDTIASMAAAIAGAVVGEDGISAAWLDRVEGVPVMRELGDRLANRADRR